MSRLRILKNVARKTRSIMIAAVVVLSVFYGWLVAINNFAKQDYDSAQITQSLDAAIGWLEANRDSVAQKKNPILWWMLKESEALTGRAALRDLLHEYLLKRRDADRRNIWTPLFSQTDGASVPPIELLARLPEYNLLFIYGLTCDSRLGGEPRVRQQLDARYCSMPLLHPRCTTHQLVGVRFIQENRCEDAAAMMTLGKTLQDSIVTQLTWDPRVGDAYIQRVLMLAESGARERIKPVWINRVLEAQNKDGGWGDLDPVIPLPNGRAFGFTSKGLASETLESDFHATAQAIWLLSLLLADSDSS